VDGHPLANEAGGLSGSPLTEQAAHCCKILSDQLAGKIPLIGVGGIDSGEVAAERIETGADLVQIYSSFIYQGPELIKEAAKAIKKLRS
jgi:dihydroorotate dehydrogenase